MADYSIFDKIISIPEEAERYFDINLEAWYVQEQSKQMFDEWYQKCTDVKTVLKEYDDIAVRIISQHTVIPLYDQLSELEIFDVSRDKYMERCVNDAPIIKAYNIIANQYQDIIDAKEAAMEYREARKESRTRVEGGGFGVMGSLKGMAAAGAMNTVTGIGHSLVNTVGNIGSSLEAYSSLAELYENTDTSKILYSGISDAITAVFANHIAYINEIKPDYYISTFDTDRAGALFENAQKIESKEQELLVSALSLQPWNHDILKYILIHFREEREHVAQISQRFIVDLSDAVEEVFVHEYDEEAQSSEKKALEVRTYIQNMMQMFHITESKTLDRLEQDCLIRLYKNLFDVHDFENTAFIEAFRTYPAAAKNKAEIVQKFMIWRLANEYEVTFHGTKIELILLSREYTPEAQQNEEAAQIAKQHILTIMQTLQISQSDVLDRLEQDCLNRLCPEYDQADETVCNQYLEQIRNYDAQPKIKDPLIHKIEQRIQQIWHQEDLEQFAELYRTVSIYETAKYYTDNDVAPMDFIHSSVRNQEDKQRLASAVYSLNEDNVIKAAKYFIARQNNALLALHKDAYNTITYDGQLTHPALELAVRELSSRNSGFFGKKKIEQEVRQILKNAAKEQQQPLPATAEVQIQDTITDKPCSCCGASMPVAAKFCARCGTRFSDDNITEEKKVCCCCGTPISITAKFCNKCGTKQQ